MSEWNVPATVIRVVDGDTCWLDLDLGWRIRLTCPCRIYGINAPELNTAAGRAARDYAVTLLPAGRSVMFRSRQLDKYGRPLGDVVIATSNGVSSFGASMVEAGHAASYFP